MYAYLDYVGDGTKAVPFYLLDLEVSLNNTILRVDLTKLERIIYNIDHVTKGD